MISRALRRTPQLALSELAITPVEESARFSKEAQRQLEALFPAAAKQSYGQGELLNASLLYHLGPVTVSVPADVKPRSTHPFVFTKAAPGPHVVCHRGTCSLPLRSPEEAAHAALKILTQL